MAKKRLLYIAPHLSTGGLPQYLLKQIEHFNKEFEIEVVEFNNVGGNAFVVQKNKIKELVPLHTLGSNKEELLEIISRFNPEIIHFQEIPQHDISFEILDKIWDDKRNYYIVVSTHGSLTKPEEINYHPDRYVLVSEWSRNKFNVLDVENSIWEYPIEDITYDKDKSKEELGFEKDWKHVLMVGLFAPGKNQGEIFEIARELKDYKIKFHFIGNQAMNFEDYWKPLMEWKPDNCVVWGERNDVDRFYKASDLFYFSSVLELMPLSIKEALSHKLPCMFRNLYTFLDTYDNNPLVHYIDSDVEKSKEKLLEILQPEKLERTTPKIQIKHLQTRPDDVREQHSFESLSKLEKFGWDYQRIVNEPYEGFPPKEHCRRPEHISKDNKPGELYPGAGLGWMTGRHYGCYLAHRGALETIDKDYDYTLIFEADAVITTDYKEFEHIVQKGIEIMERDNVYFLSFANNPSREKTEVDLLFSKTANNQDLAHAYIVRNQDKDWWLDKIEKVGWDVGDLWYNHVFHDFPQNRYTTNKVYSIQEDGESLLDDGHKQWHESGVATLTKEETISSDKSDKPILIISAGRRFPYLKRTIEGLSNHTSNLKDTFKKVWLLDDRSSLGERVSTEELLRKYFDDKFQIINFNNNEPFAFVDKFNIIKKLVSEDDTVFFLEDDWVLNEPLDFQYHTEVLKKSDWTQISFTDPLWIQEEETKEENTISHEYWKNPFPKTFKHPNKWNDGQCHWMQVSINNYTNNPNLSKGWIYHKVDFKYEKNFEAEFANELKGKHIFHHKCYFNHIGESSLIDVL